MTLAGVTGLAAPAQDALLVWVWLAATAGSLIVAGAARRFDASKGAVRPRHLVATSFLVLAVIDLLTQQIRLPGLAVELALLVGAGL